MTLVPSKRGEYTIHRLKISYSNYDGYDEVDYNLNER